MGKNKLFINTLAGLIQQAASVVSGLILPRLILSNFGSAANGLITSITQFLALISLCELGVGAVVQSSLYKPLADNDEEQVSRILASANRFFRKIALILLVYIVILMVVFPYITDSKFEHLFTASLIAIIAIQTFTQYYFSIVYKLLLNASQLNYIHILYNTVAIILSTVISAILIKLGFGIHAVKLAASVIFLIQPVMIHRYVNKHYRIDKNIKYDGEPIKQKWNGLAQHFATVILEHTDTAVLTIFSTLESVSVYAVYHLVINGIRQLFISSLSGLKSYLGMLYATSDISTVNERFGKIEWCMHLIVSLLFAVMGVLIVPFIRVYTADITDADYIVPVFAVIMVIAQGIYCIRLPYSFMVQAAGHYKETQTSAIIEAGMNVVISVILVARFGLTGVAIGTLISMSYRSLYFAWYLSQNIINRPIRHFIRQIFVDTAIVAAMVFAVSWIQLADISYFSWFIMAVEVFLLCAFISLVLNVIFYRKNMAWMINDFGTVIKKKKSWRGG